MWGFTVDDALISVRYAHNLAAGAGYRFDAHGASTDGVTPLPWPFMLAPLATGADALTALVRAKVLGVVAWSVGGGVLGARIGAVRVGMGRVGRVGMAVAATALVVMAVAFPIGAWAASGMETGVATAIATIAVARIGVGRPRVVAAMAGAVAALRPEMVVWAMVIGAGGGGRGREGERGREGARLGGEGGWGGGDRRGAVLWLCGGEDARVREAGAACRARQAE
jgi:hypothetical protein